MTEATARRLAQKCAELADTRRSAARAWALTREIEAELRAAGWRRE